MENSMLPRVMDVVLMAALALPPVIAGGEERAPDRGELLYETHCIACHDREVHWRDGRLVSDWRSLRAEVRRWQAMASLGWTDDEIDEVARLLQSRHYRDLWSD
jgi:mono/diheme cytochrome c family protein